MSDGWDDEIERSVTLKLRREVWDALTLMGDEAGITSTELVSALVDDAVSEENASDFLLSFRVPRSAAEGDAVTFMQSGCAGWILSLQAVGAVVRVSQGWEGPRVGETIVATSWNAPVVSVVALGNIRLGGRSDG